MKKIVALILFTFLIQISFAQHDNDETDSYTGGEIYKLIQYKGDDEITRIPYGKITFVSYDNFYKSYIIAYKDQSSPLNTSYSMHFQYVGEVKISGDNYPVYKLKDTGVRYVGNSRLDENGILSELVFSPHPDEKVSPMIFHLVGFQ